MAYDSIHHVGHTMTNNSSWPVWSWSIDGKSSIPTVDRHLDDKLIAKQLLIRFPSLPIDGYRANCRKDLVNKKITKKVTTKTP